MIFKYKFCLWLIDTLSIKPMTLPEIQKKWLNASANEDGDPLAERTFNRYRREAESLMYVDIQCDKRDGNLYKVIRADGVKNDELQQWLLSAFRVSNLAERASDHNKVLLEPAPPAAHLLYTVMEAIDQQRALSFTYASHYKEAVEVTLIPVFVRLFRQRWYVIGEQKGKESPKTCALERMSEVAVSEYKITLSKKMVKLLEPETYFEHCYGIIRQYEPERIRFRAFWPQDGYLRDVPVHTSQTEIERTEQYTDFEIYVRPTYDLKQELLWHRDKLAVLSPEGFREDMIQVLKATLANYETGQNHTIDE